MSGKTLIIPSWGFWIIFFILFFIANLHLYYEMESRINEYEIQEANLIMHVVNSEVRVEAPIIYVSKERVKDGQSNDGLDDRGMPIFTNIFARLEIENTGKEYGDLIWELDLDETELPEFFMLYKNNINGTFTEDLDNTFYGLDGRTRRSELWRIRLGIQAEDPEHFAAELLDLSDYRLYLNYHTKRIGGTTDVKTVLIEGDFSDFRDSIMKKWKPRKMESLIILASDI